MVEVTLENLSYHYAPDKAGVTDITLSVDPGELMVLLGPSGCGKTTTLRLIAGLLRPTRGDIRFDGRSMVHVPPEKRGATMVFQQHALFPFRSVGDNVAYGLRIRKLDRMTIQKRVASALAAVHLSGFEERWPDELSGGQRQRVALARVLAIDPKVLLLDEPLSQLDQNLREELRFMIRELQKSANITTMLVTHDQQEAIAIADRIAVLFDGCVYQVAEPRIFFDAPRTAQIARFFGGVNFLPGVKQGALVYTDAGPLEVDPQNQPDGEVLLTIRPEAIEIGRNGHNNLAGTVRSYTFHGASVRCRASVKNVDFQIVASPFRSYARDEPIVLHIPKDRICLLPRTFAP